MLLTQRQIALALMVIQAVGTLLLLISQIALGQSPALIGISAVALVFCSGLLLAYYRGWEPARYILVILFTLLTALRLPEPYVTGEASFSVLAPAMLALVLAGSRWVLGSAVTVLAILIFRAGGQGVYADPVTLSILFMLIGGMIASRMVTNSALHMAKTNAAQAAQAQHAAEDQAREIAQQAAVLQRHNDEQRQLLDLVNMLETPAVTIAEGVLLVPIVGYMDSRRAANLTKRLLNAVSAQRVRLVVLDIAGIVTVDTAVAQALLKAAQALRLLGCNVTLSGITPVVATTLTQLNILVQVNTARSPQEALDQHALQAPGVLPEAGLARFQRKG